MRRPALAAESGGKRIVWFFNRPSCSSIARLARRSIRSWRHGVIDAKTRARPPQAGINSEDQMSKSTAVVVGVGAERGLGAALCRRFAQGGHHVLVAGRTAAKINKVAEAIVSSGGSAEPIVTDATLEQDGVRLFDRAMAPGDGFEPADLVVSNAVA
jgi:hypothetical protein